MLTVLVTGANGQLGRALAETKPEGVELVLVDRNQLDISDADSVDQVITEVAPNAVINAAAYTKVDKAESESKQAFAINELGPKNLAEACSDKIFLLQVSTDFVFDGLKNTPYISTDETSPLSVYGKSKLAGEMAVVSRKPQSSSVLRTSWVYGVNGANFFKSMLHLMAERDSLGIVVDQIGTPTSVTGLAKVCWQLAINRKSGTYHWSDSGIASWYDFAEAIMHQGLERGLLEKPITLNAIPSVDYPTPAARPHYSVLDKSKILNAFPDLQNVHWQKQLNMVFDQLEKLRV